MNQAQREQVRRGLQAAMIRASQGRVYAEASLEGGVAIRLWAEDQVWIGRAIDVAVVATGPAWLGFGVKIPAAAAGVDEDVNEPRGSRDPALVKAARAVYSIASKGADSVLGSTIDLLA